MADARYNRSLLPDIQPAQDAARLELRASDADRDRTAAVLGNALATGRLTSTEHAERLDAAYTATTLGELAPLTRGLPADDATAAGVAAVDRAEVAARFSKVIRSGRWIVVDQARVAKLVDRRLVTRAKGMLEPPDDLDVAGQGQLLSFPSVLMVLPGYLLPPSRYSS